MGIETALLVGGGLIGSYIKSRGEKKAAQAAAQGITDATAQSAETQQAMFEQGQQAVQPYQQAGEESLQDLQGLMTPQGQAQFARQYAAGPQFQQFQEQAEQAALRNASATGGLRTDGTNVALASIAPQLINQAYEQRMQGLQGLTQQGAQSVGQTAQLATGVGANVGGTQYSGGVAATQPQFAADTAMSNFAGDAFSSLGGLGYDQITNSKMAPTQVMTRPGQTYGR